MSEHENLFFRDGALSQRHRSYGFHVPCFDLDFVLLEADSGQPKALCEYKHFHGGSTVDLNLPGIRALKRLAEMAGIAAWVAMYRPDTWAFKVWPLTVEAEVLFGPKQWHTEVEYVRALYRVRGRTAPEEVLDQLRRSVTPLFEDE